MTRPIAEILEQAQREGWPTSSIDAMANHHLCENRWFTDSGFPSLSPENRLGKPERRGPDTQPGPRPVLCLRGWQPVESGHSPVRVRLLVTLGRTLPAPSRPPP